jgi:hypothetical protein
MNLRASALKHFLNDMAVTIKSNSYYYSSLMEFLVNPNCSDWPMEIIQKLKLNLDTFIAIGVFVMRYYYLKK